MKVTLSKNKRIVELDILRSVAIIIVVLYHYTTRYSKLYGFESINWFKYGNLGVELFFMLSGYFIYDSVTKSANIIDFCKKRLVRLYPTYWACLIITFCTVSLFGLPGREVSLNHFLVNFTMLQYGLGIPDVDGVYWSLFYELMFYALIAICFNLFQKGNVNYFILIWLIIYYCNNFTSYSKFITVIFSLKYCPLFLSGICFNIIRKNKVNLYVLLPLFCCISYLLFSQKNDLTIVLIILIFFICFYLYSLKLTDFKWFIFLSPIALWSYEWYLLHQNIGYVILNKLYNYSSSQFVIIIPILFTAILSYAVYNYISKPVLLHFSKLKFK